MSKDASAWRHEQTTTIRPAPPAWRRALWRQRGWLWPQTTVRPPAPTPEEGRKNALLERDLAHPMSRQLREGRWSTDRDLPRARAAGAVGRARAPAKGGTVPACATRPKLQPTTARSRSPRRACSAGESIIAWHRRYSVLHAVLACQATAGAAPTTAPSSALVRRPAARAAAAAAAASWRQSSRSARAPRSASAS